MRYIHVPIDTATRPAGHSCHCNKFWAAHPDKGIAYFVPNGTRADALNMGERLSPQCNDDQRVVDQIMPDGYVRVFLEAVFDAHAVARAREELG